MKNLFNKLFGSRKSIIENTAKLPPVKSGPQQTKKVKPSKKTPKELATEQGKPYIHVITVELDPDNIGSGSFELDWNDKFLANLIRAGYQKQPNEPEHVIVDRWFQEVCRNVVLETYEQEQADPDLRRNNRRRLDKDRTEFS